jgi:hypothetical protein
MNTNIIINLNTGKFYDPDDFRVVHLPESLVEVVAEMDLDDVKALGTEDGFPVY